MTVPADPETPQRGVLKVRDCVALTVGMVVGIGVFKAPSLVALRLDDPFLILTLWAAGAAIMFVGALCYAELGSAFPDAGGEYRFLYRAYGPGTAFLFGWGRLAVVQTGAIAAVAFVLGDYAQRLAPLGPHGPALYAAAAVTALSILNIRGTRGSARLQLALAVLLVGAAAGAAVLGLVSDTTAAPAAAAAVRPDGDIWPAAGFAMIFVMLTYGGWNEAAYFTAELRDVRRTLLRVMALATALVALLYLALNAAYLKVLGASAMGASEAVGADYMQALMGETGATLLAALIVVAALSTLNATIFTGARSAYALGRDVPLLAPLGRWNARAEGPVNAHLLQAALALALIGLGAIARQGFTAMVEYTAPVFWLFLMLTGFSVILLRRQDAVEGAWRAPLHPLMPVLFCATSAYMLYASLEYTGRGALLGAGVLALGVPVWLFARRGAARLRAAEGR